MGMSSGKRGVLGEWLEFLGSGVVQEGKRGTEGLGLVQTHLFIMELQHLGVLRALAKPKSEWESSALRLRCSPSGSLKARINVQ